MAHTRCCLRAARVEKVQADCLALYYGGKAEKFLQNARMNADAKLHETLIAKAFELVDLECIQAIVGAVWFVFAPPPRP